MTTKQGQHALSQINDAGVLALLGGHSSVFIIRLSFGLYSLLWLH
jgi:hypothetical protein